MCPADVQTAVVRRGGKRMVTPARSVCLRMASGLFRSANELHDTRGRGLRLSRLQIYGLSSMGRTGLAIVLDPRKPLV